MAEITLCRQPGQASPSDDDKAAARRVLFGFVDGLGETNKKAWRRFVNGLLRLEPGEIVDIITHRERIGWYHRKHFAMEAAVFDAQERFEHYEQWRAWVKMGAGHCDWVPGPKGAVVPVPRSISYAKLGQDEMEEFHSAAVAFLRTPHALKVMWPKASPEVAAQGLEDLLESFGAFAA